MENKEEPKDNLFLHALNILPELGPKRLMLLANYFQTYEEAFYATPTDLIQAGIDQTITETFIARRDKIILEEEKEKLAASGIALISFRDSCYPKLLKEIPALPPLLYVRGEKFLSDELCVAVVGTRNITTYGRSITEELVSPLARQGITIVSGLAYGVDALAHQCAINAGKRTIAVVASGVDEKQIYPKDHAYLASQIIANGGCVVSEYPPETPALKQHFVARNRIISGLCLATMVIECNTKSGALITARHALDQNRQVFAIPGPIYSQTSAGPNNLLKMGATCVTEAADVLSNLNIIPTEELLPQTQASLTPLEEKILQFLNFEPVTIDEIIKKISLEPGQVTSSLTFLEMKGRVKNIGGQQYILARKV